MNTIIKDWQIVVLVTEDFELLRNGFSLQYIHQLRLTSTGCTLICFMDYRLPSVLGGIGYCFGGRIFSNSRLS